MPIPTREVLLYYANYLRWMEMGRCELIEGMGMTVQQLASQGVLFAVAHVEIDYIVSAVLGDVVEIEQKSPRLAACDSCSSNVRYVSRMGSFLRPPA